MRVLRTEGIGKSYGDREVVRGVNLEISQGEVVGLLGPNGAGKTTSFYMIVGLVRPDAGRVLVDGAGHQHGCRCICGRGGMESAICRRSRAIFRKLTVEENILAVLEAQRPELGVAARRSTEKLIEQLEPWASAADSGVRVERRGAAAGGDCAVPGDRAGVYPAGRAVFGDRSDRGAGSAGDYLCVEGRAGSGC